MIDPSVTAFAVVVLLSALISSAAESTAFCVLSRRAFKTATSLLMVLIHNNAGAKPAAHNFQIRSVFTPEGTGFSMKTLLSVGIISANFSTLNVLCKPRDNIC